MASTGCAGVRRPRWHWSAVARCGRQHPGRCGTDRRRKAGLQDFVYLPRGVPHAWTVTGTWAATKLILAVPGGIESFFDDLGAGVTMDNPRHRHGVRFLG